MNEQTTRRKCAFCLVSCRDRGNVCCRAIARKRSAACICCRPRGPISQCQRRTGTHGRFGCTFVQKIAGMPQSNWYFIITAARCTLLVRVRVLSARRSGGDVAAVAAAAIVRYVLRSCVNPKHLHRCRRFVDVGRVVIFSRLGQTI